MKAILCKDYGPAENLVIEDIASPDVKGSGVKIRVKAAGLNFPDTLIIEGKYQIKPELPFSPGGEMAGEVIAVGNGKILENGETRPLDLKVGDRVLALSSLSTAQINCKISIR